MKNKLIILQLVIISLIIINNSGALAQGDGPRSFLLAPTGLWGIDAKWLNLEQNIVPAGNFFIPGANIKVNVFPVTAFHTFSIEGRFALIFAMINPGSSKGSVNFTDQGMGEPTYNTSGLADGFVGFKIGLVGAPALNVMEFSKKEPAFSMIGSFRLWYSGTYDASNLISMGTNRWTFEFGLPMSMPFGNDQKFPFWLETVPAIEFYTTNSDPAIVSFGASETRQKPLFTWENHLTKNLTPLFWVGVSFRYQYGGASIVDDSVNLDSKINILGVAATLGYQALPYLGFKASYGDVIWGYNGADSRMFRLNAVFTYADLENLK